MTLMSVFSTVVIAGIVGGIVKVIEAAKNAKLAVIAATKADTKADANAQQLTGLQHQVTQVALNAAPAAVAGTRPLPVTFEAAQLGQPPAAPDAPNTNREG